MASSVLRPGYAQVQDPHGSSGAKEYVPVDAAHESAIAAGRASAENGVPLEGFWGPGRKRRVRFNCSYNVMDSAGNVTVQRAGHERIFDPRKESMADRACEGIRYRNPTFEDEVLAMGPRGGGGRVYPKFLGWSAFPTSRLKPELPRSFGVKVAGR